MKLKIRKFLGFAAALAVTTVAPSAMAATIALWTFESITTPGAGPFAAESGVGAAASQADGGTGGAWTTPAGNGSPKSWSSTAWDVGDYFQFKLPTTGYTDLNLSFDQTGSNTGPRDFAVYTSTDGSTFSPLLGATYSLINGAWSMGTPVGTTSYSFALPASLEGLPAAYIRLVDSSTTSINGGTVAAAGTGRVDNVLITGTEVPEPAMFALVSLAGLASVGFVRRR